ncbi:unnamed protein product [Pocillopora meandrina]|uniref:F5/8 type C domain-containing protein n=1 Tax=Pocillopora meandrina TaxID=46732 RepID=A0AAU9W0S8_9CNID|nr:unnamed protein product [Pocillopora meandrina]
MQCDWVPIQTASLGKLPGYHECEITYSFDLPEIPAEAKEVLVYTFMTTIGNGCFQRGYYEIFTSGGGKDFKQYMNVATGDGINIVNSINAWFPVKDKRELKVKLYHPTSLKSEKKHIAGELEPRDWSDVYIIGYRT